MPSSYKPHQCHRPGCTVITKNRVYCSKKCSRLGQLKDAGTPFKVCKKCKTSKPFAEFVYKNHQGKMRTREWCKACCDLLPQEAKNKRAAAAEKTRQDAEERKATVAAVLAQRESVPIMVDATGRFPAVTLDQLVLGGLPGTSIQACPFAA